LNVIERVPKRNFKKGDKANQDTLPLFPLSLCIANTQNISILSDVSYVISTSDSDSLIQQIKYICANSHND